MRRKRSQCRSSGTSVHHVRQIPSTQLDVGLLERELLSRDLKAESAKTLKHRALSGRRHTRSSSSFSSRHRQNLKIRNIRSKTSARNLSRQTSSSDGSKSLQLPTVNICNNARSNGHSQTQVASTTSATSISPRPSSPISIDDANANARNKACSRRKRGRPRTRPSGSRPKIIKIPVNSVLRVSSNVTTDIITRKKKRRRRCKSKTPSCSSKSSRSPKSCPSSRKKRPRSFDVLVRKKKNSASCPVSVVSRYRVTPCPTNGGCSSNRSRSNARRSRSSSPKCPRRRPKRKNRCSSAGSSSTTKSNRSDSNSSKEASRHCRSRGPSPSPGRWKSASSRCSRRCPYGDKRSSLQAPLTSRRLSRRRRKSSASGGSGGHTSKAAETARGFLRQVSGVWSKMGRGRRRSRAEESPYGSGSGVSVSPVASSGRLVREHRPRTRSHVSTGRRGRRKAENSPQSQKPSSLMCQLM